MQALTKKRPTEKLVEVRFRGTVSSVNKLRRTARELHVVDLTEQKITEKDYYAPEELSSELKINRAGVCIRGGRVKEGLTQKQLAEQIGIAQHHISEMENGKRTVGKEMARKLSEVLNVDYRVFL
ncbi:MAG: helix-turn-helix transcriptional regulator [Desulfuromonadales bacterium]|nr:helix-turn-helix transcriptional regulator [Desulfuromonadales bacterium]